MSFIIITVIIIIPYMIKKQPNPQLRHAMSCQGPAYANKPTSNPS